MLSREGPQARMVEMMVEHKQERKGGEYWEVAQVLKQKIVFPSLAIRSCELEEWAFLAFQ